MDFNIVETIRARLDDGLLGQFGHSVSEDVSQSASAISATIPGLLQSLSAVGKTQNGAQRLWETVNKQDDSILENLPQMLQEKENVLSSLGINTLTSLLGDKKFTTLSEGISDFSDAPKEGVSTLLGMFSPMVLSV